ncbi:MAG: glutaredoxin 3 [Actinobacteria bacterium]|nr:glutaredoxin 3 [Actinomycetota bacterium]
MADVVMYKTLVCPYCSMAGALLKKKGVSWREVDVTFDAALRQEMEERSGRRTVPQIVIDDVSVGGYDDLVRLDRAGELDQLLGLV